MSNAIIVPDTFKAPISSVFAGEEAGNDMSGGVSGGYGLVKYRGKVWSIQYQGNVQNLMREDGDGPRGSIDVVVLRANPALSKTFYVDGWDENNNNPPDCASANGITPDAGVPRKQADVCALCPKNAWNSAPNGGKGKACGDHRRMAVVPLPDLRNEGLGGPLLLRCPAASLQDLAAFDARYKGMGYPYYSMGIKIGFDPQESFPKFVFTAIRPLTDAEAVVVKEMRDSPLTMRVVNESTSVSPAALAAPTTAPAFIEAPTAQSVQPQQVAAQPVAQPAAAQPTVAPAVVQPQAQPVGQQSQPSGPATSAGGFGASAPVTAAGPATAATQPATSQPAAATAAQPPAGQPVAAAQATQPAPVRAMTGFGPATPEGNAQVSQPTPAAQVQQVTPEPIVAPTAAPGVVSAFEGSIDERLTALLG